VTHVAIAVNDALTLRLVILSRYIQRALKVATVCGELCEITCWTLAFLVLGVAAFEFGTTCLLKLDRVEVIKCNEKFEQTVT
jgi:hypothetical protein